MCGILNVFLTTCIRKNKMAIRKGNPGIGNLKEMMDEIKAGTMVFEDGMFKPAPVKAKKAGGMMKKGYAKGKMVKKMMAGGKTKKMMSAGKLVGGQKKLDKNNDGKISGDDFKKMKAGGMTKKSYAKGKMVKKGMAAGGKAKGKAKGGKSKVRGAGIARKGVRSAKMR